ncbi:OPT oligopeptide transporter protein [uncultured archaeon]|nr:OPT oligopeptide transporter protein [uncultured archaeon]
MTSGKFPWRAIIIGSLLSVLVALYSAYAGLKIGGVYWPMVTTAVVSLALMRLMGNKDENETNVMQTTATTGGLLAAGIIFTIPALFMLGLQISALDIILVSLTGGLLALLFVYPLREEMVIREKLPYADGAAAAAIIKAGDEGGKQSRTMIGAFAVGAIFAIVRDVLLLFPSYFNLETLKVSAAKLYSFGSQISLIPFAGGYLIGFRFTLAWFIGAVATYFFLVPYAVSSGMFADKAAVLVSVAKPLGAGVVIGAAVAYFITSGIPVILKTASYYKKTKLGNKGLLAMLLLILVMTYALDLSLPLAALAVIGAFVMAFIGAKITGEMNVDPMEIFALVLLLAAKFIFGFGMLHLVLLAAIVCIAAGVAGDAMMDFKTGHLLGTNPLHQLAGEAAGVITASLVMGFIMLSFAHVGFGTVEFPAPQAVAVKEIAQATGVPIVLMSGMLIGFVLTLILERFGLGATPIAFGIGLYVPIELSVPLFIGGIIRHFVDKAKKTEYWRLVAGGLIAGEGLVGAMIVLAAAAKFFGI